MTRVPPRDRPSRPQGSPLRVQLSRRAGWRMPAHCRSVARPTRWGNPWVVGQTVCVTRLTSMQGSRVGLYNLHDERLAEHYEEVTLDAAGAVALYAADLASILEQLATETVEPETYEIGAALLDLHGWDLACWCKPGEPCHADVLLWEANRPDLRAIIEGASVG